MNFAIYAAIAAVITIFFTISYIKQRRLFQLAFALWVPSTLLQYVCVDRVWYNVLSLVEIGLFVITMILTAKEMRERKRASRAELEKMLESDEEEKDV